MFALMLEDSIEQLQHNYHNNIFENYEMQVILDKFNYKPNKEQLTQTDKITFGYSNPINIKLLSKLLKFIDY